MAKRDLFTTPKETYLQVRCKLVRGAHGDHLHAWIQIQLLGSEAQVLQKSLSCGYSVLWYFGTVSVKVSFGTIYRHSVADF